MKAVNTDAGAEIGLSFWLCEELGMPASNGDRLVIADCIRLLAKEGGTVKNAAQYILHQAQMAQFEGTTITLWWFKDRKYLPAVRDVSAAWTPEKVLARQAQDGAAEREAYEVWSSMSQQFKLANPWEKA